MKRLLFCTTLALLLPSGAKAQSCPSDYAEAGYCYLYEADIARGITPPASPGGGGTVASAPTATSGQACSDVRGDGCITQIGRAGGDGTAAAGANTTAAGTQGVDSSSDSSSSPGDSAAGGGNGGAE